MTLGWFAAFLLASTLAQAQFGTIIGTVVEQQSGEPVVGATIRLSGLPHGAVSRRDGSFVISRVPAGVTTVLVSAVGYHPEQQYITVPRSDTIRILIRLRTESIATQAVVVSAARRVQSVQEVSTSVSLVDAQAIAEDRKSVV